MERELLKRTDTKFVAAVTKLPGILDELTKDFALLPAGDSLIAKYETQYFDTEDLKTYREHCRGRRPRHKVRIRNYCDRDLRMLEIKMKTNAERTLKWRSRVSDSVLTTAAKAFVKQHFPWNSEELLPSAQTNFKRVTLLGIRTKERVTIDLDLDFQNATAQRSPKQIAIIEVKQERFSARTPIMMTLRRHRLRQASLSKYCMAIASLYKEKSRLYQHKLRQLRVSYA